MKQQPDKRSFFIDTSCYLHIALFVYAAVSKMLDFESFQIQLGQSPLLGVFAGFISIAVPLAEIFISVLLLFKRTRLLGLLLSFSLMILFTTYIIIILNWTSFIPCSCGGILEKMGWTEHLIFNVSFILLSLLSLLLIRKQQSVNNAKNTVTLYSPKIFLTLLFGTASLSIIIVIMLFMLSEDILHRNNAFTRRYPQHPVNLIKGKGLKYNSYYIAGVANGKIYLGNTTAPLHLLQTDTSLTETVPIRLKLDVPKEKKYSYFQIKITGDEFYLSDPTVPAILKGLTGEWLARDVTPKGTIFSIMEPAEKGTFFLKISEPETGEDAIAFVKEKSAERAKMIPGLLNKQIDGIFDIDGTLIYNKELGKMIYVYYYRNEYMLFDTSQKIKRGKTIDTISKATIKLVDNVSKHERKLATPPIFVNRHAATAGKYLFIKSERLGRFEPEHMLSQASIVDVYNLLNQTYEFSFYLYDYEGEKIKSFVIDGYRLIGITEHYLVTYRLEKHEFEL